MRLKLENILIWIKLRLYPSYKSYWCVKPKTLDITFNDPQELFLHCSMQILCDFYEDVINRKSKCKWDYDENFKATYNIMGEIYYWWTKDRVKLNDEIDLLYIKYIDLSESNVEKNINMEISMKIFDIEKEMKVKDSEMLHKLVDIREYLWD